MALNVVLMTQRQSPNGMALSWGTMEGVSSYTVFVATKKLSPEELEAAMMLGGTDDCVVAKFGAETVSVVDDVSPAGEARYYGVAMSFSDGAVRAARFRCVPDGATAESRPVSGAGKAAAPRAAAPAARPAAAAAPAARPAGTAPTGNTGSFRVGAPAAGAPASTGNTGSFRVGTPGAAPAARPAAAPAPAARPAAAPAAEEDPLEARKRAQREARLRAQGGDPSAAAPAAAEAPAEEAPAPAAEEAPAEDPMEARKRAQREARERAAAAAGGGEAAPAPRAAAPAAPASSDEDPMEARRRAQAAARAARDGGGGDAPVSNEQVKQPSEVPLDSPVEFRMSGGTQTWDGLRLYWERDPRAAAYEIVVSDHQIFPDELGEALAGRADFTSAVAVNNSVTALIDNVTPREARGWYLVLARGRDGTRTAHPFKVGDAAESGKAVAGFVNPNRTGELRVEVEDLLAQAKDNWDRWKSEQDGGARREAQRLVKDALLIFPNYPAAKSLQAEVGA